MSSSWGSVKVSAMVQQVLWACFVYVCLSLHFWEGVCGNCIKGDQEAVPELVIQYKQSLWSDHRKECLHVMAYQWIMPYICYLRHRVGAKSIYALKKLNVIQREIYFKDTAMKKAFHETHRLTLSSNQNLSVWTAGFTSQIAFVLVCSWLLSLKQRY